MFEVGDLVVGIDGLRYFITNNNALMEVKRVRKKRNHLDPIMMGVQIIKSLNQDYKTTKEVFPVEGKYFRLATPEDLIRFN